MLEHDLQPTSLLSAFEFNIHQNWSSEKENHRYLIRRDIQKHYSGNCLELDELPKPERGFVSISHCKNLGGYIWAPFPVGLDMEAYDRKLSKKAASRLGSPQELKDAPDDLSLWVAKEAAYKALSLAGAPEKVISSIQISNWREIASKSYEFSFLSSHFNDLYASLRGQVFTSERTRMGIAALIP